MTRWEYKIVWVDLSNYQPQPILNDHGKDGWELVAVDFSDKTQPEYTFKRPLPPEANHDH